MSKPPSPQALKQTVSLTSTEIQRAEILETARIACRERQPITVTLEKGKLVSYQGDKKTVIRLTDSFNLYELSICRLDKKLDLPATHIIDEDSLGYQIFVPIDTIKSVIAKK